MGWEWKIYIYGIISICSQGLFILLYCKSVLSCSEDLKQAMCKREKQTTNFFLNLVIKKLCKFCKKKSQQVNLVFCECSNMGKKLRMKVGGTVEDIRQLGRRKLQEYCETLRNSSLTTLDETFPDFSLLPHLYKRLARC